MRTPDKTGSVSKNNQEHPSSLPRNKNSFSFNFGLFHQGFLPQNSIENRNYKVSRTKPWKVTLLIFSDSVVCS